METIQLDDSEHIERQARAAFVIKDHIIVTTMETRIAIRQILSRSQGEAAEAANTDHQRQVLIKQGDGRYLYMRAITNEEIQEVLSDLPTFLTTDFDWEALKGQMSMLLTAEIIEENYSQYLKQNEDLGSMGFEDKIDMCAHGILMVRYARRTVPRIPVAASVHSSDSSPAPSDTWGDSDLPTVFATPETSEDSDG